MAATIAESLIISGPSSNLSVGGTVSAAGVATLSSGASLGAALNFTGTAAIQEAGTERGRIDTGVFVWGATFKGTTPVGGIVTRNGVGLYGVNVAGTATYNIGRIDSNNVVQLGDSASGIFASVGFKGATLFPAGSVANNGIVCADDAGRLVYYSNGSRYRLTGTAF